MKQSITICNFSHIYEQQTFYLTTEPAWINCTGISGANCYCDEEAADILRAKIMEYPAEGIHFIDSGNYHYMTKLWADKITVPFSLVLFDNHPDMQPPAFFSLLSCGGWALELLEQHSLLQQVLLIGVEKALWEETMKFLSAKVLKRILCFPREDFFHTPQDRQEFFSQIRQLTYKEGLYLSIDKDVLNEKEASTDWSQGSLTLSWIGETISILHESSSFIGADICGECRDEHSNRNNLQGNKRNDAANGYLLRLLQSYVL